MSERSRSGDRAPAQRVGARSRDPELAGGQNGASTASGQVSGNSQQRMSRGALAAEAHPDGSHGRTAGMREGASRILNEGDRQRPAREGESRADTVQGAQHRVDDDWRGARSNRGGKGRGREGRVGADQSGHSERDLDKELKSRPSERSSESKSDTPSRHDGQETKEGERDPDAPEGRLVVRHGGRARMKPGVKGSYGYQEGTPDDGAGEQLAGHSQEESKHNKNQPEADEFDQFGHFSTTRETAFPSRLRSSKQQQLQSPTGQLPRSSPGFDPVEDARERLASYPGFLASIDWSKEEIQVGPEQPPHVQLSREKAIAASVQASSKLCVLLVAEKPSVAQAIANALAGDAPVVKHDDGPVPTFQFDGAFKGFSCMYLVTSVTGHLYSVDFVEGYENWQAVDPASLFCAKTRKVGGFGIPAHLAACAARSHIVVLWLDCDREGENICFEVLHNVAPALRALPPGALEKGLETVYRAQFSSLTPQDIRAAMNNSLTRPNKAKALAVDARQELDLKLGASFTRFQCLYFQGKYSNLNSRLLSYGPCLTPTLAFCVERADEISSFVPEPYWLVAVAIANPAPREEQLRFQEQVNSRLKKQTRRSRLSTEDGVGDPDEDADQFEFDEGIGYGDESEAETELQSRRAAASARDDESTDDDTITLAWTRGRIFVHDIAAALYQEVRRANHLVVSNIVKEAQRKVRPIPLNTVELLKVCSRQLGISPKETMRHAESLYLDGYISYPRVESTAYPKHFPIIPTLRQLSNHPLYGDCVRQLLGAAEADDEDLNTEAAKQRSIWLTHARAGVDVGDHPPITPTRSATPAELGGWGTGRWRVYDYVTRHFIATVSPDCEYATVHVSFEPYFKDRERQSEDSSVTAGLQNAAVFTWSGVTVQAPGFTEIMPWRRPKESLDLSQFVAKGELVVVRNWELRSGETEPPSLLSESDLVSLMEQHGIGTDASIPMHIANVVERNYVQLKTGRGRLLQPTELGSALIHGYKRIDPELCLPTMRAQVEKTLSMIADGKADYLEASRHLLRIFRAKYLYFIYSIAQMDMLFEARFSVFDRSAPGKVLSKCGKCKTYMMYFESRPARLYCATCDEKYLVPTNCEIKQYEQRTCPYDGFEVLMMKTKGLNGALYPFCPMCWNYPPVKHVTSEMTCSQCRHPTCPSSQVMNAVALCPHHNECEGILVFQPLSRPNYKIICCNCNYMILVATGAYQVSLVPLNTPADVEDLHKLTFAGLSTSKYKPEERSSNSNAGQSQVKKPSSGSAPKVIKAPVLPPAEPNTYQFATCGNCEARLLRVNFNYNDTPLPDGRTEYQGCLFCDPLLVSTAKAVYATDVTSMAGRGLRHRGSSIRGGGRGGGGRSGGDRGRASGRGRGSRVGGSEG